MRAVAIGAYPENFDTPRQRYHSDKAAWLYCPACGMGAFVIGTNADVYAKYPGKPPFPTPENLSAEIQCTWSEALNSYSASAFTACALMCRKIIFHIAAEAGLPEKDAKGWAPKFEACINHLVTEGYITERHKTQWVDSIRVWGNIATHELAPTDKDTAYSALEFTKQLLEIIYSFPGAAPGGQKELDQAPENKAITP